MMTDDSKRNGDGAVNQMSEQPIDTVGRTPQQCADELLSIWQANRHLKPTERAMTLAEWDQRVSPHLQFIEAGCEMAARHVGFLPIKPDFETKAEAGLERTRKVLEGALAKIKAAQKAYHKKAA